MSGKISNIFNTGDFINCREGVKTVHSGVHWYEWGNRGIYAEKSTDGDVSMIAVEDLKNKVFNVEGEGLCKYNKVNNTLLIQNGYNLLEVKIEE